MSVDGEMIVTVGLLKVLDWGRSNGGCILPSSVGQIVALACHQVLGYTRLKSVSRLFLDSNEGT